MEDVVIRCMRFITGLFSSWAVSNKNNVNLKIFTLFSGLSQRKEKKEGMKETATTSGYRDRTFIQLISDWFRPKVNSTRHRSFYTSSPHSLYSLFLFLLRFYFWECRYYKTRIWAFSRAMVAIFGSYILDLICTRCTFFLFFLLLLLNLQAIWDILQDPTTVEPAKAQGKYIEGSLYRTPPFNEFSRKLPKCSLYRGIVNN